MAVAAPPPPSPEPQTPEIAIPPEPPPPILQLGPGDSVAVQVYGQPDMAVTVYVSDDGTIPIPLAGNIQVAGLSPAEASRRVEAAYLAGKFLVDPHVTLTVTQSRSQRVAVFGQVGQPGRFPIESNTSIFDILAQAGGVTENGSDIVYILRTGKDGKISRYPINLKGLTDANKSLETQGLMGGDSIYVPKADQFYIYGEVSGPGKFRVEPGMTVIQAIVRAGGITIRGSKHRVEVTRKMPDGTLVTSKAKLSDLVRTDDVIQVKESIF
jgi:polysaccharide export outer membrane protein